MTTPPITCPNCGQYIEPGTHHELVPAHEGFPDSCRSFPGSAQPIATAGEPKGECRACHRQLPLNASGLIPIHDSPASIRCAGSHQPPSPAPASTEREEIPAHDALLILHPVAASGAKAYGGPVKVVLHSAHQLARAQDKSELEKHKGWLKQAEIDQAESDKQLCQFQDALGCPCEMADCQEKAMERLRDLIAAEGELGDLKAQSAQDKARIAGLEKELDDTHTYYRKHNGALD